MDEWAFVLSLLAFGFSIYTFCSNKKTDERKHRNSLEAEYFSEIYKEYLIRKLPEARRFISFSNTKLEGVEKMIEVLKELEQDSLYYFYKDNAFYKSVKAKTQELQDYLAEHHNNGSSAEDQGEVLNEIKGKMEKLYECITAHLTS